MILIAPVDRPKRWSKGHFKDRRYEAVLILRRSRGSCAIRSAIMTSRSCFLERGLEVDYSTLDRWGLMALRRDCRSGSHAPDVLTKAWLV
jgi:hypothetical protein